MLVLMLRGLFTDFTFPYASFPSTSNTGEQSIPIFLEALIRIEASGFHTTFITLDGNTVNRKFFKLISSNEGSMKHKFKNPLSNDREIFLFSDPPHLISFKQQKKYVGNVNYALIRDYFELLLV